MAFDFKKEFKEYYLPATKPAIVEMPVVNYLGDPRKTAPEKLKTVIRYPIRKA